MKHTLAVRVTVMLATLAAAVSARAESSPVVIKGGPDESGHNYAWDITNYHGSARIVYIEFPHYRADLFHTPSSWTQKIDNVAHIGWKDRPGTCVATPEPPYQGLPPGATAQFGMRIASGGALVGKGDVLIRFDDGSETTVAGVTLPTKPEQGSAYLALIGTGAIFVLFILLNERRRRKKANATGPVDEE